MKRLLTSVAAAALAVGMSGVASAEPIKNIVLVHGAFADGSGWRAVTDILERDGYSVSIVQEPETSLADDAAATKRIIERVNAPLILVGHSYGGAVITQAGNEPQVRGLVYIAAFQPDSGETLGGLLKQKPPAANSAVPAGEGYVIVDPKSFHADFAADVPAREAHFMAISQVPISVTGFGTAITNAAWHNKPSWYAVATEDRMINPDLERFMAKRAGSTTVEVKGSHAIYLSQPQAVANLIERAAKDAK
ncbi:alpha/beta hydrolase [Bradyrhizobium sp. U87765 SZCCT0131]|uniref:alpha/beta fold hydrolase n=1 Tax=unclassified Bradyrhizobium TaxID=2631580 RepID=UPI001BA87102|nr:MULTISPECIES: alpha/beta hydrolase [unclassified Bradyrhizobium]MBR1221852.1 alpha/beta hydrolase [Bradyrhizobium sp. U87765 SZCCT0131]MBR1263950.1 alpha/beta hydrolase [Bradyrhizobium sp. U87765 SZCCT0134]MBR1308267.1 alpha/beta hydrolase [Bradyrhizobium sp. U87765 SZCCT0110]MBR1320200.1 alpha/beta hydrolase [Bradyrhizobium sp. U87765 SZCCT0109]MBR1348687.1 alpha/beta hydrolase [Bradyrhizobium sp. U87765 SZCCT0048]